MSVLLCFSQLYLSWYEWRKSLLSVSLVHLSFLRMFSIALAHVPGSSDETTKSEPNGIPLKASPNPEFELTRMGRPADKALSSVKPKPSSLVGKIARSASRSTSFNLSWVWIALRIVKNLGLMPYSTNRFFVLSCIPSAAPTNKRWQSVTLATALTAMSTPCKAKSSKSPLQKHTTRKCFNSSWLCSSPEKSTRIAGVKSKICLPSLYGRR